MTPTQWTDFYSAGFLPEIIQSGDDRPAAEQLDARYAHGGGFMPFEGFTLNRWETVGKAFITYPEDPPLREVSRAVLRDETLILFECEWLAIVQKGGSYKITRVD